MTSISDTSEAVTGTAGTGHGETVIAEKGHARTETSDVYTDICAMRDEIAALSTVVHAGPQSKSIPIDYDGDIYAQF
jgi:hypothetical protein